jgi:hypothetical protein
MLSLAHRRVIAALVGLVVFLCFVDVQTSHAPQSPSQSAAAENKNATANQTPDERTNQAIARYTRELAYFTAILAIATIALGIGTVIQIRLSRREFLSTHRPKLRIRRIFLRDPLAINQVIQIRMLVVNVGDTDATLDELGLAAYVGDAQVAAEPTPYPTQRPIPPGNQAIIDWNGPVYSVIDSAHLAQGGWLHALGVINYRDDIQIIRTTAFARRYVPSLRRFVPVPANHPESDREYED